MNSITSWFLRYKTWQFLTVAFTFAAIGLIAASIGPCILELARRTATSESQAGLLVTVRGTAYTVGSAFGGPLFDRYDTNRIFAISLAATGFATCGVTFVYNYWGVAVLIFLQGISSGLLDTGGNVSILWIFNGQNPEPYLQACHFFFAIGALVSPLVVGVVMDSFHGSFDIAFYVIAATFIPVVLAFAFLDSPTVIRKKEEKDDGGGILAIIFGRFNTDEKIVIALTAIFMGFYVGAEHALGTLVYTYAVKRGLSSQTGYLLNSVFWSLVAAGRLLAIPVSTRLQPQTMLLVNVSGCLISSLIMTLFDITVLNIGPNQTLIALWIGVPLYGLFMSSSFPTYFTMAEKLIVVSGKAASFFVIGASLGSMVGPAIVASLFDTNVGYFSLPVTTFIASIVMFIDWGLFILQKRRMLNRGKDIDETTLLIRDDNTNQPLEE